MLQKVLVPLNLQESDRVVSEMCARFSVFGAEKVVLLHVGSDSGKSGDINKNRMEKYASNVRKLGFETNILVRPGSVQLETVRTAAREQLDFISIPFKPKSWLSHAIFGSNVKDVIRQSDLPVFIYKHPGKKESKDSLIRVLFAASLKGGDEQLSSYIRNNNFQADEVALLHVGSRAPDPVVEKQRQEKVELALTQLKTDCGLSADKGKIISVLGTPQRQIVKMARQLPANLVLLGKADSQNSMESILGSTAEEVSYDAPCSVLIIPKKEKAL